VSETPTTDAFESLLINNPRFADIDAYISRFNPIRVMKMEHMEIRHSAILGWLLSPQETHGLGDDFLKAFLSEALSGRDGADPTDDERYAPINYADVFRLVEDVVERQPTTPEVSIFIRHYINILKEAANMSEDAKDIQRMARELYRENRAVIDFIVEHGSDTDFTAAAESLFKGDPESYEGEMITIDGADYEYGGISTTQFDFLPESWADELYSGADEKEVFFEGCEDWWMGYPLITWIELQADNEGQSGRVALYGEVGRVTHHETRVNLIDRIQAAADENQKLKIKFRKDVRQEGKKYSKFFYDNFQSVSDVNAKLLRLN